MNNLSNLAVESDACRELLTKSMVDPFLNQVVRKPLGIIFKTAAWRDQSELFWKFVLRETLHSAKFGMFSDKSVRSFMERILVSKLKPAWLQCRKDYAVYLQADGTILVFYPTSFPCREKDMYSVDGEGKFDIQWQQERDCFETPLTEL